MKRNGELDFATAKKYTTDSQKQEQKISEKN